MSLAAVLHYGLYEFDRDFLLFLVPFNFPISLNEPWAVGLSLHQQAGWGQHLWYRYCRHAPQKNGCLSTSDEALGILIFLLPSGQGLKLSKNNES